MLFYFKLYKYSAIYLLDMFYFLNHNYGKVSACGDGREHVTIYNQAGKLHHIVFNGELELSMIDSTGYITTFFGSSGYKLNQVDSWQFCDGWLLAFVNVERCYVLTENNNPLVSIKGDANFDNIERIVFHGQRTKSSNVRYIKRQLTK